MLPGFLNHLPNYPSSFDLANLLTHSLIIILEMTGNESRQGKIGSWSLTAVIRIIHWALALQMNA